MLALALTAACPCAPQIAHHHIAHHFFVNVPFCEDFLSAPLRALCDLQSEDGWH